MDKTESRVLGIFTKIGIVTNILPYLGYYVKWKYLMTGLWTKSNQIWFKNQDNFEKLHYAVQEIEQQLLKLLSNWSHYKLKM